MIRVVLVGIVYHGTECHAFKISLRFRFALCSSVADVNLEVCRGPANAGTQQDGQPGAWVGGNSGWDGWDQEPTRTRTLDGYSRHPKLLEISGSTHKFASKAELVIMSLLNRRSNGFLTAESTILFVHSGAVPHSRARRWILVRMLSNETKTSQ
jgi:hypothetical protein